MNLDTTQKQQLILPYSFNKSEPEQVVMTQQQQLSQLLLRQRAAIEHQNQRK